MYDKNPYKRQRVIFVIFIGMWVLNFFIAPLLFIFGKASKTILATGGEKFTKGAKEKVTFWSWFINTDEPTVKENLYGDEGYLAKRGISDIEHRNVFVRFWWFWLWNVIRNSFFYYKMHVIVPIPKKVEEKNIRNIVNTSGKGIWSGSLGETGVKSTLSTV